MAGFSKQYCERHMPDRQWDFDIDEIVSKVDISTTTIEGCEGYGFTFIGKKKDGKVVLGYYNKNNDTIDWKPYADVVSPTKIRFDDIVILNGDIDSDGSIIRLDAIVNLPKELFVDVDFEGIKSVIGKACYRHTGTSPVERFYDNNGDAISKEVFLQKINPTK